MLNKFLTTTATVAFSFATISSLSFAMLLVDAEPAFAAGNGNNGNGNGNNGNGNNGNNGNGNGAIASGLGALNAANANENARLNAAGNSRVGLIAIYQAEALLTQELAEAAAESLAALEELEETRSTEEIQADIDAAILAGEDTSLLEEELAAAVIYEAAVAQYELDNAASAEQALVEATALDTAANKDAPTGEALVALRDMLGL